MSAGSVVVSVVAVATAASVMVVSVAVASVTVASVAVVVVGSVVAVVVSEVAVVVSVVAVDVESVVVPLEVESALDVESAVVPLEVESALDVESAVVPLEVSLVGLMSVVLVSPVPVVGAGSLEVVSPLEVVSVVVPVELVALSVWEEGAGSVEVSTEVPESEEEVVSEEVVSEVPGSELVESSGGEVTDWSVVPSALSTAEPPSELEPSGLVVASAGPGSVAVSPESGAGSVVLWSVVLWSVVLWSVVLWSVEVVSTVTVPSSPPDPESVTRAEPSLLVVVSWVASSVELPESLEPPESEVTAGCEETASDDPSAARACCDRNIRNRKSATLSPSRMLMRNKGLNRGSSGNWSVINPPPRSPKDPVNRY